MNASISSLLTSNDLTKTEAEAIGAPARIACQADGRADDERPRLVIRGGINENENKINQEKLEKFPDESVKLYASSKGGFLKFTPNPHPLLMGFTAITDWLNFSFPYSINSASDYQKIVDLVSEFTDGAIKFEQVRERGKYSFTHSIQLSHDAIFAYGGLQQRGKVLLSFSGTACRHVPSWEKMVDLIVFLNGTITRWDGAVDDLTGKYTLYDALDGYMNGLFDVRGHRPSYEQVGDWEVSIGKGKTLYIGDTKSGKIATIYEKGKQLGEPNSPWVRYEILYGNVSRIIPLEVLIKPAQYVAGAYPYFSMLIGEGCSIKAIKEQDKITYEALTANCKRAYGKHIDEMMRREPSNDAVVNKLRIPGRPKRLIDMPEHLKNELGGCHGN